MNRLIKKAFNFNKSVEALEQIIYSIYPSFDGFLIMEVLRYMMNDNDFEDMCEEFIESFVYIIEDYYPESIDLEYDYHYYDEGNDFVIEDYILPLLPSNDEIEKLLTLAKNNGEKLEDWLNDPKNIMPVLKKYNNANDLIDYIKSELKKNNVGEDLFSYIEQNQGLFQNAIDKICPDLYNH